MKKIYKYELSLQEDQILALPEGAKVLSVNYDCGGFLCLWALVNPIATTFEDVKIKILGTGWELHNIDSEVYFTTVIDANFVWHIFIRKL